MTSPELIPCPFCGAGQTEIRENTQWMGGIRPSQLISVEVNHWCTRIEGQPTRKNVHMVGRDRESAIKAWNTRNDIA